MAGHPAIMPSEDELQWKYPKRKPQSWIIISCFAASARSGIMSAW